MSADEFNQLVDKYLRGEANPEEELLVDEFFKKQERGQSLQHYKLSEEMWSSIHSKIHNGKKAEMSGKLEAKNIIGKQNYLRRILVPIAIAASVSLAVVAFFYQPSDTNDGAISWVTSKTSNGQKTIITLMDGSRVSLNSGSSISYPQNFEKTKREIILHGEAFFEVTRDEKKPFIVRTENVTTQVLGTSFNINAFEKDNIKIAVASGKVKVQATYDAHISDGGTGESDQVILMPNEEAVYSSSIDSLTTFEVDINQVTAWRNNTLYFDGASLDEVALQLERWYNVSIRFENEQITSCRINGQYKDLSLQAVLESIQYMHQVDFKFENQNKVILYGKGCN